MGGLTAAFLISGMYLLGMGTFNWLKVKRGPTEEKSWIGSAVFFTSMTFLALVLFSDYIPDVAGVMSPGPLLSLAVLAVSLTLVTNLSSSPRLHSIALRHPYVDILRPTSGYIVYKSMEILFQQTCIVLMLFALFSVSESVMITAATFGLLFTGMHLPLILFLGRFAFVFIFAAAVSTLVVPATVLMLDNGFVYSYVIHWAFYIAVVVGVFIRELHRDRTSKFHRIVHRLTPHAFRKKRWYEKWFRH